MNGVEIDRTVGEPNEVVAKLAPVLAAQGFEILEEGPGVLEAKRKGKLITADVTKMRLLLDVKARDGSVRFRFHTGALASMWTDKDRAWAGEQADALLAALD